jgi:hypothetical protein
MMYVRSLGEAEFPSIVEERSNDALQKKVAGGWVLRFGET